MDINDKHSLKELERLKRKIEKQIEAKKATKDDQSVLFSLIADRSPYVPQPWVKNVFGHDSDCRFCQASYFRSGLSHLRPTTGLVSEKG